MPVTSERPVLIFVQFGPATVLGEALRTIIDGSRLPHAILLWENYSSDEHSRQLQSLVAHYRPEFLQHGCGIHLYQSEANLGFGAACNRAVAIAWSRLKADYCILANPDVAVERHTLESFLVGADKGALSSPTILSSDGRVWWAGSTLHLPSLRITPGARHASFNRVPFISGCFVGFGPEVWERIGGFDERYFLYWEDVAMSLRASVVGVPLLHVSGAVVTHEVGAMSGGSRDRPSEVSIYWSAHGVALFSASLQRPWRYPSVFLIGLRLARSAFLALLKPGLPAHRLRVSGYLAGLRNARARLAGE